ncbi:MAG: hypothetical protein IAI50_13185, partial [Candidatus Eremiobacteraeota bacterium]|nr:hypothetical protein [Candidatus Eremiobacteraeota bacterium]
MARLTRRAALLALCIALCGVLRPCAAMASPDYVDKRVSAISSARLLAEPGKVLVDPRRQRVARTFNAENRPLFFFAALSEIFAFFYVWSSGYGARLRGALRRRISNAFAVRFAYGASLAAIAALAALPANFV